MSCTIPKFPDFIEIEPRDGGRAFPNLGFSGVGGNGMTLRDWFAGQALVGLLTGDKPSASAPCKEVASWSYELADAMLAERAKGGAR